MIAEYLKETAEEPFRWGQNDCALWCCTLVHRVTGRDPGEGLRGQYSTWRECRNLLHRNGGLLNVAKAKLNFLTEAPCREGIAVASIDGHLICGILTGDSLVMKTPKGGHFATKEFTIKSSWTWSKH